jgi:hypothetical protein
MTTQTTGHKAVVHASQFFHLACKWFAAALWSLFHPVPAQHVGMFAGSLLPYEPRE